MNQKPPEFNFILAEALQEGLSSICPSIPSVVFFHLKKNGSIRSDRYIDDPEALDEGLKKIFGFGAKVIEKKILEILYKKLQIPREVEDNFRFAEKVKNIQKLLDTT